MKKIINTSNKRLIFPKFDFVIDANEIKEIPEEHLEELLGNVWIKEVLSEKFKKEEIEIKTTKGRKNKNNI